MIDGLYVIISILLILFLVWQRKSTLFVESKQGIVVKFIAFLLLIVLLITSFIQKNSVHWSVLLLLSIFCITIVLFQSGLGSVIFKNYRVRSYGEFDNFKTKFISENKTEIQFYSNNRVRLKMILKGKQEKITNYLNNYFVK